jgi:hypothetical protein
MLDFYKYFYNKEIQVHQAVGALNAWLHQHLSITEDLNPEVVVNTEYCLQFIPAFEMLVPHVASVVEFRGIDAEIVRVYLEIHTGKWNTEEWSEVLRKEHLPQLLTEFFGICNPEEDLIIPFTGMIVPRFMDKKAKITYPPCTCRGCDSPICPVRRRRRRR